MFSARFLRSISRLRRPEEAKHFLRQDQYWCPEVIAPLIQRCEDLANLKPRDALGFAEIAVELVNRMREPTAEIGAHAYCVLAAIQRYTGKLAAAESNFELAEGLAAAGSLTVQAMVARQKAALLTEQGKLELALPLAKRAVELDREAGSFPAKSLNIEGTVRYFQGDFTESTSCWMEVLKGSDPKDDVYLYAMNNLVNSLIHRPLLTAEVVEARRSLRSILERIRGVRETPVRYQVWYTEACLHVALEEYREAINHFMQARAGFLRLGMIRDFGRVSVDLIDVLLKKGDEERARVILERTAKTLAEFEEHRRLLDAFLQAQALPIAEAAEHIRLHLTSPQGQDSNFS